MTQQMAERSAAASAAAPPAAAAAATATNQQMDRSHRYAVNVAETLRDLDNWQQKQELTLKMMRPFRLTHPTLLHRRLDIKISHQPYLASHSSSTNLIDVIYVFIQHRLVCYLLVLLCITVISVSIIILI